MHAIFCDSLEVYDADWTADMLEQFRSRRGYDLRPLLPLLERDAGDRSLELRRDFGRTLSELYEERFLVPLKEWSRKNNVLLRIQNYGEPPATLSSCRHADLIDGEGWKYRELTSSRWASSASHLFGKPVTTSETWTWLHSPAFRATPLDVKAEADQHFLSGINQLIGHGWPYSPPAAGTPGWPFYAAAVLSDKNPWWPVMPDLAAYLHRVSFVLRQGEPVADVALYAPTEDAWATFRPGASMNLFRKIVELVGPNVVPGILAAGHSFDLVDDGSLKEAEARRYKAIVLPGVRFVPEATRRFLADYAPAGGKVIAVRRKPDGDWPSVELVSDADLSTRLAAAVPPDVAVGSSAPDVGFVHRRLPDADVYFLANTTNGPRRVTARFRAQTPYAELWNAFTGKAERVEVGDGGHRARPRALRYADRGVPEGSRRRSAGEHDHGRGDGGAALGMDGELRRAGERRGRGPAAFVGGRPEGPPLLGDRHLQAHRHHAGRFPQARRPGVPRLRRGQGHRAGAAARRHPARQFVRRARRAAHP